MTSSPTDSSLPETLYKFGGLDRIDIIANENIRYTRIYDLNDPFEVPRFEKEAISEMGGKSLFWNLDAQLASFKSAIDEGLPEAVRDDPEFRERLRTDVQKVLVENNTKGRAQMNRRLASFWTAFRKGQFECGVLSVSEAVSSPLMWAHYADNHSGIAIGFDPKHRCFGSTVDPGEMRLGEFRPVIYCEDRPSHELMNLDPSSTLFHKFHHWAYEREWRSIKALDDAKILVDQPEPIHLFSCDRAALKEIVFGYRVTREEIKAARAFLGDCGDTKWFKAVPSAESYWLEKSPLFE